MEGGLKRESRIRKTIYGPEYRFGGMFQRKH